MQSVMKHQFSNVPNAEIQRSTFDRSHGYKTTFDAGRLIPFYCDEVLPGDTFNLETYMFVRMNTPLYPIMDNMFLDIHYFSVPMRLVWDNFRKFMGEQTDPADSIDYTIPITAAPATTGYGEGTLEDYLGLPTKVPDYEHSALFVRAYRTIYNEWYKDQNLSTASTVVTGDGPDTPFNTAPLRRKKRHDYFTSCLPWLQKGDSINLPLGERADIFQDTPASRAVSIYSTTDGLVRQIYDNTAGGTNPITTSTVTGTASEQLYADLSTATSATINELRQSFQIQRLLERDARSGTRYFEIVKAHFGVDFPSWSYRPEFLGGITVPININPIAYTAEGTTTNGGDVTAFATASVKGGGFTKSFTEHCILLGIASVRADLTYQQGLNRMWSRSTRYDFYMPVLAHLGEQAVLQKEIYTEDPANVNGSGVPYNETVFGYQERWSEYRYKPSVITGLFRSNAATPLDAWHLSQEFSTRPELNNTFLNEDPPIDRIVAVPSEPDFIMDSYLKLRCTRPMPIFSVPGLIDHL